MSLPRMSLHIGDYRKDTGHLRAANHGAYLLLIMHYWATGGLPDDDEQLAAIACMTPSEWRKARPVIEKLFKPGWKHSRVDAELQEAQEKYERRAAAGRKGGRPQKQKQSESNAFELLKQPITENQERDGGGGARARACAREAFDLALSLGKICGFEDAAYWPPGWAQAPRRVQQMLDEGWLSQVMLDTATSVMRRRREKGEPPPETITYFEKPFARAHAECAAPLPAIEPERGNHETARRVPAATWQQSRDDWRKALAEFGAGIDAAQSAAGRGSGSGEADVFPPTTARRY